MSRDNSNGSKRELFISFSRTIGLKIHKHLIHLADVTDERSVSQGKKQARHHPQHPLYF
jgi:hypothetical protein